MRHLIPFVDMTVVAPVPYFPRVNINKHWSKFAAIPGNEQFAGFEIDHPRYLVIPKLGMATHGLSMFGGSLRQVSKRLSAFDYDLIDAHYVYPDGLAATMLGSYFRKPVVLSARGSDINLFSGFRTIRPMIQHALKHASRVIAVTRSLKNVMVELGCPAEKIDVIGNGIDAVKFTPEPRSCARQKLNLPADRPILLAVGNLNENKGFQILVKAIEQLRATIPDVLLMIVGEGLYRGRLESLIRDLKLENNVRLAGAVPHAQLSSWYNAADVFCLASLREGCPNVILEAMACGCPIVATRAGGVPDLVTSESYGILVERTPASFEAGVSQALTRAWDRQDIVDNARTHSWDNVTTRLLRVYSEVLATSSSNKSA